MFAVSHAVMKDAPRLLGGIIIICL